MRDNSSDLQDSFSKEWVLGDSESKQTFRHSLTDCTDIHRRTKFSHDPNNTAWANSTDSYGQRMLQSHGWTPGASLGARNKSYTKAKGISHIRVTLKDDNLGLGAKSGPNVPQPGLDAFQGLLGRLNGKSDGELAKEQNTRDGLRRANYAERRWGGLHFISGGLLVGDRIEEPVEEHKPDSIPTIEASETASNAISTRSTGTEAYDTPSSTVNTSSETIEVLKGKKSKKRRNLTSSDEESMTVHDTGGNPDHASLSAPRPDQDMSEAPNSESSSDPAKAQAKLQRRAERAQRKLDRQARKAAKRAMRAEEATEVEAAPSDVKSRNDASRTTVTTLEQPTSLSRKTEKYGRNAVRQRYILQKKMALADPRALNEV